MTNELRKKEMKILESRRGYGGGVSWDVTGLNLNDVDVAQSIPLLTFRTWINAIITEAI